VSVWQSRLVKSAWTHTGTMSRRRSWPSTIRRLMCDVVTLARLMHRALTLQDPTQLGRLSRNAIPQDWASDEAFPGVINTTTSYRYVTYLVNVGMTPFVQVLFDSLSLNTFVSAYDTTYDTTYVPNSAGLPNLGFDTHWLGDAGFSGNAFGTDPVFFRYSFPRIPIS
jgi:hypothetical protein